MGLSNALNIGKTGLFAAQTALEVTGNNLANIATQGYHRRSVNLAPMGTQRLTGDMLIGRGVQVESIVRHVNEALEGRIRTSIADQAASEARRSILSQVEALENELSGNDLSTYLSEFFDAWSELANNPRDNSLRSLVVQQGARLGQFVQDLQQGFGELRIQTDKAIDGAAAEADDLLETIARLNRQIIVQEAGSRSASSLRDERGLVLAQLGEYLDISTIEQAAGGVDVFVGSLPVVLNNQSRGLEVRRETVNGELQINVVITDDGSILNARSGRIGALVDAREADVTAAIDTLDQYANDLIYEVNRVHSQGQGLQLHTDITGTYRLEDPAAVLNDAAAGLEFDIEHGSFQLHVTQTSTGQRNTSTISVGLDGIGGNDTTLNDLVAALNTVANISASVTPDGRLQVNTVGSDFALSFSDDSSGALAALGVNTYFDGKDASDIAVNELIASNVQNLAASQNHDPGDNGNALLAVALRDQPQASLNNMSLYEVWTQHIEDYAVRLGQTSAKLDSDSIVRENLEAQQQQASGVNADEEAINLLIFQRTFQASARFIQVVDELLETTLTLL